MRKQEQKGKITPLIVKLVPLLPMYIGTIACFLQRETPNMPTYSNVLSTMVSYRAYHSVVINFSTIIHWNRWGNTGVNAGLAVPAVRETLPALWLPFLIICTPLNLMIFM